MSQQPDTTRMGRIMIVIGFVFGIGLLTLFFNDRLEQQLNPNQKPESIVRSNGQIEVLLDQNRQGHYVMSGSINGVEVDFLLDTGATDVAIPESIASQAELPRGRRAQAMTANGIVNTWRTTIDRLQLGEITLNDVRASITPSMGDGTILLGMSALRELEFTQQGSQLTLRYQP